MKAVYPVAGLAAVLDPVLTCLPLRHRSVDGGPGLALPFRLMVEVQPLEGPCVGAPRSRSGLEKRACRLCMGPQWPSVQILHGGRQDLKVWQSDTSMKDMMYQGMTCDGSRLHPTRRTRATSCPPRRWMRNSQRVLPASLALALQYTIIKMLTPLWPLWPLPGCSWRLS